MEERRKKEEKGGLGSQQPGGKIMGKAKGGARGLGKKKKKMPTAPGVPRRSPIQVLTGPNVA